MTEQEWLANDDPAAMLGFIGERMSDRKQRLFAVACCRRVGHLVTDGQCRQLLELTERCLDDPEGLATELASLREAIVTAYYGVVGVHVPDDPIGIDLSSDSEGYALHAILLTAYGHPSHAAEHVVTAVARATGESIGLARDLDALNKYASAIRTVRQDEESAQTSLLRDILGNPFRLQTMSPSWLSHAVVALARTIHTDHAFDRMPILADALEEAGCTDEAILSHCRGPGLHVRGCWVVDLLLGKE